MADCDYLQSQLTSILNSLVKIAVVELLRVVEDSAVELRLEVSQTKLENEALRIENESNKNKIQSLGAELLTAGNRQCPYCCRVVEYLSPKTDGDASGPSDPFSEDHDASWLQQSEYAHTVDKSTATRNAVKQYLIKKEQQGDMQGKMETQTGISTGEGEQHCPKVDMVFDKEWSQVLWQGGDGFKEDGESSEPEEEDIPGLKDDGDSSGQDEDDPPGPSAIHRQMHITIREGRSLPDLKRCATCCKDFHCPFCRSAVFQPTKLSKVTAHLERHFNRAIFHEGYTIHRCGLNCRPQWHYHCIHCQSMLSRKPDFIKHLAVCKKKHHAKTTTNPAPTSTVPSVTEDGTVSSNSSRQKPKKKCRELLVALNPVEENKKDAMKVDSVQPSPESHQNTTVSSNLENILAFGSSKPESCLSFEQNNSSLASPFPITVPKCVKLLSAAEVIDSQSYMYCEEMINSSECNIDITKKKAILEKRGNGMKTDFCKSNVNFCFVCGKPQLKISRHLKQHVNENAEIAHMLSLDVDSKQRRVLMEKIRNKGNFQHNAEVISKGSGSLKVKRRTQPTSCAKRYEPCIYCKGMFVRQELWRHKRRCPCKPEGIDQKCHYGKRRFTLEVGHNSGNITKN